MTIKNAKQFPKVYYAKHITPGIAEYHPRPDTKEILLIQLDTLKRMNPSFTGRPVYVDHQEVILDTLTADADGYVCESFYNSLDGAMWLKMIIVSDEGHKVIKDGYGVSNAYLPVSRNETKGQWHNVDYDYEVTEGEYEHLALVENPRYEEAVIMTEEEFKKHNNSKEEELKVLQNSKEEEEMLKELKAIADLMAKLVKNEEDKKKTPEELKLEADKVAEELKKLNAKNDADEEEKKKKDAENMKKKNDEEKKKEKEENDGDDDDDEMYNVGDDEEVSLKELKNFWKKNKKKNDDDEKAAEEKKNEEEEEKKKKEENSKENFNKINNAGGSEGKKEVDIDMDQLERGTKRYGTAVSK